MSNIDFLANKKNNSKKRGGKDEKRKIEWTKPAKDKFSYAKPAEDKRPRVKASEDKSGKSESSGWFSFFKKNKKNEDELIDQERLKRSRQEVLKLIDDHEKKEFVADRKGEDKESKSHGFLSWKKKSPENGEKSKVDSIDYKKSFKNGEAAVKKTEKIKAEMPPKRSSGNIVLKKEESGPKKEGLFDKLINFWRLRGKRKLQSFTKPASGESKQEPVGTGAADIKEEMPIIEKISDKAAKNPVKNELKIKKKEKKFMPDSAKKIIEKESRETWKKAKILETNLIKGELASFFNWRKGILILALYFVSSALIVAGLYGGLLFWEQQIIEERVGERSSKISDLDEQVIKPLEEDAKKILITQEKIKLAEELLGKHIYWTNFFKFLEDNTLAEVYYTSAFSGDTGGQYSFLSKTRNFKTILDQVNVMRMNDYVKKVTVSSGSMKPSPLIEQEDGDRKSDVGGVNFKLELSIDPNIFLK